MSTSSAPARPSHRAAKPSTSRTPWLIAFVVVVIGVAALIALIGTGGGSSKSTGTETAPVTVSGTALAGAGGSGLIDPATDPAVGKTVPSLSGSTPSGTPISYAPNGKPTIYLFVAHWCPHCQAELPRIAAWIEQGSALSSRVAWRTISTAVNSDRDNYPPSAWFTKTKWDEPVMVDSAKGDAATAFGLQSFPYLIFVDSNGVVKQRATGELTLDELQSAIRTIAG